MIETYLSTRKMLKGIVLIMDIRRVPGTEERNLIDWLRHYNIPILTILTKTDKLSKTKQNNQLKIIAEGLGVEPASLILFSAKTRKGRDAVWNVIKNLVSI